MKRKTAVKTLAKLLAALAIWSLYLLPAAVVNAQVCQEKNCDQEYETCLKNQGCAEENTEQDTSCDLNACYEEKKDCYEEQAKCLEEQINQTQQQARTLSSAIEAIDREIRLQQLQISQTLAEIFHLEREIAILTSRIEGLSLSLDSLTDMLISRIQGSYKQHRTTPLLALFVTDSFTSFVNQYHYLKQVEIETAKAMERAENQRQLYDQQKSLKEAKQQTLEGKKQTLLRQRQGLQEKKQSKQRLLQQTKNDEALYQKLLRQAQQEINQISSAANTVVRTGNAVQVERGEVIGTMGNSGYSTGPHLHFGVYKYSVESFQTSSQWDWYYNNYVNPLDFLESEEVFWDTECSHDVSGNTSSGSGSWRWPMDSVRISQNYGSNTCYNWMYGGNPHPALDMVGTGDLSIRAVEDGEAYFCRNCLGDGGNGVFVFHDNDYMSLYWHLK